jgi:hypothetical protein
MGRQDNYRRNPTQETDHVDFATGAFFGAAHHHKIEFNKPFSVTQVGSIPEGLQAYDLGGGRAFLATVYEEPITGNS